MADRTLSIGPYAVRRKLRSGGMAEIVLAERVGAGERVLVALKLLLSTLCTDEDAVSMFRAEAELTSRLAHPGVPRVLDHGHADGRWFIALEYLSGWTLHELFDSHRPLPADVVIAIGRELCTVLHHVHEHGVVHRDLSLDNAMLTRAGRMKLIDFGLAAELELARASATRVGNPAYAAPEALQGRPTDRRADVFALGVLLHELIAGARLFRRDNDAATLLAVVEAEIPRLSPELERVVHKALERDPERRFASALELRAELEQLGLAGVALDAYARSVTGR